MRSSTPSILEQAGADTSNVNRFIFKETRKFDCKAFQGGGVKQTDCQYQWRPPYLSSQHSVVLGERAASFLQQSLRLRWARQYPPELFVLVHGGYHHNRPKMQCRSVSLEGRSEL